MSAARHACGGAIRAGQHDGLTYQYCDRCFAFAHDVAEVPAGTDRNANIWAWDEGEPRSPGKED